jgi:hypothetical protein
MVGPVLGEIPGGVQPERRRAWIGPAHRLTEGVQVNGLPEVHHLVSGNGQLLDEQPRADPARGGHPFVVEAVQEGRHRDG